jgi:ABC-type nitrate/sulfonate/bicarbonate transport system permease component
LVRSELEGVTVRPHRPIVGLGGRLRGPARLRHLVLRSASPQIVTGMRQALSIGIILMVISEMLAASSGLGFTVVRFQRGFAIPEMWGGILLLGLLGVALSLAFRVFENRVLSWYHQAKRGGHPGQPTAGR